MEKCRNTENRKHYQCGHFRASADMPRHGADNGSITVIALMVLVTLTLVGMMAMNTSSTDVLVAGNYCRHMENFYVADGGINREMAELGSGQYPVMNIESVNAVIGRDDALNPNAQANDIDTNGNTVADNVFDHSLPNGDYEFDIVYLGHFLPPPAYSASFFYRYDFNVNGYADPGRSNLNVTSRCYKIGPKPSG